MKTIRLFNPRMGAATIMVLSALVPIAVAGDSSVFLSFDAGLNLMGDADANGESVEFDPGVRLDAGLRCHLNNYACIGFEAGYIFDDVKDYSKIS